MVFLERFETSKLCDHHMCPKTERLYIVNIMSSLFLTDCVIMITVVHTGEFETHNQKMSQHIMSFWYTH